MNCSKLCHFESDVASEIGYSNKVKEGATNKTATDNEKNTNNNSVDTRVPEVNDKV